MVVGAMEVTLIIEGISEWTFREKPVAVALVRGIEIQWSAESVLAAGIGRRKELILWRMKRQVEILRDGHGRSEGQECNGQLHLRRF